MNLTPKQQRILTLIRDSRLTRGYSPTMQELADELAVSKVTVFEHVEALIKKGALRRDANKARSLELTEDCLLPDEQRPTRLPLVGRIAAGSPIDAVEDREFLDLEELFAAPSASGETFVLRVTGDSMIDAHVAEGDFVICRQTSQPRNGDMVVALIDNGEATLKYFFKDRAGQGRIRLQPANEKYEPIWVEPEQLQVQGVVIGIVRAY